MPTKPSHPTAGRVAVLGSVGDEEREAARLEARLRQALAALNGARAALHERPDDFARASEVMRHVHALRDLRERCAVQRARVQAARSAAGLEVCAYGAPTRAAAMPAAQATFRAAQAQHAGRVMAALAARPRTCPACQAMLPHTAARCHCGCLIDADPPVRRESLALRDD